MTDPTDSGTFLVSNLPPKALGGIDLLSFTPGPNFCGVKLLPPGFHFVFTGTTDSFSLRNGLWFKVREPPFEEPEVHVFRWDSAQEHIVPEESPSEQMRLRANLGSLWNSSLLTYRQTAPKDSAAEEEAYDVGGDWKELTSGISTALVNRIAGHPDAGSWAWSLTTASSAKQDSDDIPGLSSLESKLDQDKELRFLPIDLKQTWRSGATGRERTEAARDRSWALKELVDQRCSNKETMEVLGELQFCFIMVLTLANYSCLEQWKRLLGLIFTCQSAVEEWPGLFVRTIQVLRLQLKHSQDVEGGLFDMSEDGGALLKGLIRKFKKGLEDISGQSKADVLDELEEFEDYLRIEFGWEIGESFLKKGMLQLEDGEQIEAEVSGYEEDDEAGEFAPQIVDLTPAQRRALSMEPLEAINGQQDASSEEEDGDLEDMDQRY